VSGKGVQTGWVRALSFDDLVRQVLVPIELPRQATAGLGAAAASPAATAAAPSPAAAAAAPTSHVRSSEPSMRYARTSDGVTISYGSIGDGPALVLVSPVPFSNVVAQWRVPHLRDAYDRLSRQMRLIVYDGRGTGGSQRDVDDLSLEAMLRDLDAVVSQAEVESFALFGNYTSVPSAIAYAARNPRRVTRLALLGGSSVQEYRGSANLNLLDALLPLADRDWNLFIDSVVRNWVGWWPGDEGRLLADAFEACTTPDTAKRALEAARDYDVSADLGSVAAPALVLHRDAYMPLEVSQRLAEALPDGRLLRLTGASGVFFFEDADVDALLDFLTAEPGSPLRQTA